MKHTTVSGPYCINEYLKQIYSKKQDHTSSLLCDLMCFYILVYIWFNTYTEIQYEFMQTYQIDFF